MSHILQNLLTNALKFSKGNPYISIQKELKSIHIRVIDDGIGIPEADLPHLFEPFYRASNATAIQGTGLGLSIAQQFILLLGGSITVESEKGKGTAFHIILPSYT